MVNKSNSKKKEMLHPFLIGKDIYLRGLELSDIDGNWWQWSNDQGVTRYMTQGRFPNSREKMVKFYNEMVISDQDIALAIIDKRTNMHIGNVGLHQINWVYRIGEIGIIIGERKLHGKSYGSQALRLLVEHAFQRLGLIKIWARVDSKNIAAVKGFEKAGFIKEAVLKREGFAEGKYRDSVYMAFFKEMLKD